MKNRNDIFNVFYKLIFLIYNIIQILLRIIKEVNKRKIKNKIFIKHKILIILLIGYFNNLNLLISQKKLILYEFKLQ